MRLSVLAILAGSFLAAAAGSLVAAGFAVSKIEANSEITVRQALDDSDLGWAEVEADGLQVVLTGVAPTEARRFSAKSVASTVVDASRVIDSMEVQSRSGIAPPRFSVEILRNGPELSLIGLIPMQFDRDDLVERAERLRGVEDVSDLLQTADYPVPEGWGDTVDYALDALRLLPQSKISLSANAVSITAMSQSSDEKRQLQSELTRRAGTGIALSLDISAPRPIVAPYTLRFVLDDEGARFDACTADTEAARKKILDAARELGVAQNAGCLIGLGVPSSDWSDASARAIRALGQLGAGTVSFSDADISLIAAEGTDPALFDDVVGTLENALPEVYALHAVLPETPDAEPEGPPEFLATLSPEGLLQIRGRLGDELTRNAVESLARARFGSDKIYSAARLDDMLPETWPLRVLTALDALSQLSNGSVTVTPDEIAVRGNTGDMEASDRIARLLGEKLGNAETYAIDVTYQEKLDPIASIPTPEECLANLRALQGDGAKINFEPGSTNVASDSLALLDQMAEVLKECPDLPLEIAGHTDSQGREEMNLNLSQQRAQAILNELRLRRVLTRTFVAQGYGESQPIADNGTEEGREANRRIEFSLIDASAPDEEAEAAAGAGEETATREAAETPEADMDTDTDAGTDAGEELGSGDEGTEAESDEMAESDDLSGEETGASSDDAPAAEGDADSDAGQVEAAEGDTGSAQATAGVLESARAIAEAIALSDDAPAAETPVEEAPATEAPAE
ncbi:MAG: OmpA family protein [Rhodobacteraceae bacterium]|nr:OmpA family protein [Paracoccaceae bacterium]MBR9820035.1 OmpA family protein [Paracoccaceae bacterium]